MLKSREMNRSNPSWSGLARLHQEHRSKRSLGRALGDGYLYQNNPLFQAVRDQTLSLRYSYVLGDLFGYFGFPEVALMEIYRHKKIPYLDNAARFVELASTPVGKCRIPSFTMPAANHVFHESAHAIANAEFFRGGGPLLANSREGLFAILLVEAFANSVETMASIYNVSGECEFFLDVNSFIFTARPVRESLWAMIDAAGFKSAMKYLCLAFLMSNFLFKRLDRRDLLELMDCAGIRGPMAKGQLSSAGIVAKRALALNPQFRLRTTATYLKLLGFKGSIEKICGFDPLIYFRKNPAVEEPLDRVIAHLGLTERLYSRPHAL